MKHTNSSTPLKSRGGSGRGQGRRAEDGASGLRRINVTLDGDTIETLRRLGGGELSLGIRRAAKMIRSRAESERHHAARAA